MVEFTPSPHAWRRAQAVAMGAQTRNDAWTRIVTQAREPAKDPRLKRTGRAGEIGVVSSKTSYPMRMCQNPLYVQPRMAREWFNPWNIVGIQ